MDGRIANEWVGEQMDACMDGQIEGWMDWWVDK